jgi:hypothetical protein
VLLDFHDQVVHLFTERIQFEVDMNEQKERSHYSKNKKNNPHGMLLFLKSYWIKYKFFPFKLAILPILKNVLIVLFCRILPRLPGKQAIRESYYGYK